MSLADYLAKNYLTPDAKPEKKSKKRKRKEGHNSGLTIQEDDASGWINDGNAAENDDTPLTVGRTAEFRKSKKNAWTVVGAPAPSFADQAAADAIISAAAKESSALALADDDAPVVEEDPALKMESGAHAGLQTASQVAAQMARKQAAERKRFLENSDEHVGKGTETIYRDASGRIINIAMKRAEARKKMEEEAARAKAVAEEQKGDVQRAEREKRRETLQEAKFMPLSRYADDAEMNDELRQKDRWNDPAAQFMAKKRGGKSATGKPLYAGSFMPNRYGIRPGHRWDGVDRGNGFEKEYFAAINRRRDLKELDYAWQGDE
ncbi:MAG: hypothetical protein LQ342_002392 [Letrouitia transgressa]|nr:MAG: hypothetical protein LQ342_002392 [Letrouitia transgressa]